MRILAFLLSMLLIPVMAGAQSLSGWVLWQRTHSGQKAPTAPLATYVIWEPQDGFERLADCRAFAIASGQSLSPLYKDTKATVEVLPGGTEVIIIFPSNPQKGVEVLRIKFVCFPGTLDPRPRPEAK